MPDRLSIARVRYLRLARRMSPMRRFIHRLVPPSRAPHGINLVGYLTSNIGLGQAARGMGEAIAAAGIPLSAHNHGFSVTPNDPDRSWERWRGLEGAFSTTLLCANPDQLLNVISELPDRHFINRSVIASWYWELEELPAAWRHFFGFFDEIWAPTRFVHDAIARSSPVPVTRIPTVVALQRRPELTRESFGLPAGTFIFLLTADPKSQMKRKNPEAAIAAFVKAFAPGDTSVMLLLKFPEHAKGDPEVDRLQALIGDRQNVRIICRSLSRAEMDALTAVCDCLVSLHRAEGFGLGPAEAMAMGKPTILTNWSGNTDYMTDDNCFAVRYSLIPVGPDSPPYDPKSRWAQADVEHAAHGMQTLARNPELCRAMGHAAKETMEREYSPAVVGQLIASRLAAIDRVN